MKRKEVESLFTLAGFEVLGTEALINQYNTYDPDDPRFMESPQNTPWWFIKTPVGWIKFGRRKSIFNIDWSECEFRGVISEDNVTKGDYYIHAWSIEKALEYLMALRKAVTK